MRDHSHFKNSPKVRYYYQYNQRETIFPVSFHIRSTKLKSQAKFPILTANTTNMRLTNHTSKEVLKPLPQSFDM